MTKVAFFYLHGSDPLIGQFLSAVGQAFGQPRLGDLTLPGLNGAKTVWVDGSPRNDPFCNLLDPNIFEATKLLYPALGVPMDFSINVGIGNLVNAINDLPSGQKFMIGGYSQGAAVASSVMLRLRSGGDLYSSRGSDFLGGVCFGNPRRQTNFRGEVGGTWSGSWDVPNSTTGGGGVFSATGPFPRLTNCDPTKWIEFVAPGDIVAATGSSSTGQLFTDASDLFLNLASLPSLIAQLLLPINTPIKTALELAGAVGGQLMTFTDAVGRVFQSPGSGHVEYPWVTPVGDPDNGLTSYQIAAKWLTGKANAYATAPILLPSQPVATSSAGWSTTLIAPSA